MPISSDQYFNRGGEYTGAKFAQMTNGNASGTDGIEISKREPYFDERTGKEGLYTQRIYRVSEYLPRWISAFLPSSALTFYEDSYSCFPYTKSRIDGLVLDGKKTPLNPLDLDDDALKVRQKIDVDIGEYTWDRSKTSAAGSPSAANLLHLKPSSLKSGWQQTVEKDADACCTVVTVKVPIWGIQTRAEGWVAEFEQNLLSQVNQQMYCWADEWVNMSDAEVKEYIENQRKEMSEAARKKNGEEEVPEDKSIQVVTEDDLEEDDDDRTATTESDSSKKESKKDRKEKKLTKKEEKKGEKIKEKEEKKEEEKREKLVKKEKK